MNTQKTPFLQRASTPVFIAIVFGVIISLLDWFAYVISMYTPVGQLDHATFAALDLFRLSGVPNGSYLPIIAISLLGTLTLFLLCFLLRKKGFTQDELPRKIAVGSLIRAMSIAIMFYGDWIFVIQRSVAGEYGIEVGGFAFINQFSVTLRWVYYLTPFWILCLTIVYAIKHRKEFNKLGFVEREKI